MINLFDKLQAVGKALMLPVAVLPAAAILLRFGANDLLDIDVLERAGGAIFDNLPIIFAIGIAFGLAHDTDNNGAAGLAGFVCHAVLTASLKSLNPDVNLGIFAGIVSGLTAGFLYNRFYKIRLPEFVGFFGGRRFVPIVTSLAAIGLALMFSIVWPPIQDAIDSIGNAIVHSGGVGTFVYGVLNRLLIPLGLHHILNNLIWFVFGTFTTATGDVVHGDLTRFFAGDATAGSFMTGFFPVMMFGLPAAVLAMYRTARPENRPKIAGALASMALTSFLTGITEPIEFSFMFLAPQLYVLHALLTGLSMFVCHAAGILIGFGFSAGFIDFVLNWKLATRPELILPIGLAFGAVYYVVFSFAIVKFNLPTIGRVDEEISSGDDFANMIVDGLGGHENLLTVGNCATRLRVTVKDASKVDEKLLKSAGAKGVFVKGNAIQVVIGTQVEFVAAEINSVRKS
ncbi:MAG: PTS transporter subunit EIIC [Selenomonadaceae bacterium]|nr:PTS transporter subunit EIIC [Selenomonadaceae bacterium]